MVDLTAFRRATRAAEARARKARAGEVTTSLHIDIYQDGKINSKPLVVSRAQALSLLKLVLAVSNHLVEVHAGRAG
ncbi:hypothetical protein [Paraburkholderia largidicola]|uniref:hypothetical protein n=1 Tax=Paraburkholderia largidicola TaxID=3014751 RepID=UPI0015D9C7C1|nr:hypothetical protein [Paraburkholderia sp. PGU16]